MLFKNTTLIDENYQVQKHMNILVENQQITYIGKKQPANPSGEVYNGENKLIMPGFFNNHCHVPMTLLRGYGEGLPLDRWLNERIFPFEGLLTQEDIYWGSQLGIAEMIKSGVVGFTDMYLKLKGIGRAVRESGIKANISYGAMTFDQEKFSNTQAYQETLEMLDYIKDLEDDRLKIEASVHGEYTSNPGFVEEIVEFSKDYQLGIHAHMSETESEVKQCKIRHKGLTPVQYFDQHGVFSRPTTGAHCVWLEEVDYGILKNKGVTVAHCPSSNMKLASGIAPIQKMLDHGISVTIGTDGAASNNNLNMLEEINLASMLQKVSTLNPLALGPQKLLELACRNGALAQGRINCGSIQVGNKADLFIVDLDKPHLQPVHDVLSNMIYSAQSDDICLTMVNGKILYQDGEYQTIDIEKVLFNVKQIKDEKIKLLRNLPSNDQPPKR